MTEELRSATHEGELPLGGRTIGCAVLGDGTRVLTATAVFAALDRPRKGSSDHSYRADQMPAFLTAKNLQPFVDEEIRQWTSTIDFLDINGNPKSGYDARILRGVCKVYIEARNSNQLHRTQIKTAEIAQEMLYALADRGIESLVDEATGFDAVKYETKDKVTQFLERSLSLEPAKWVKTFSDDFFEMIFRLKKWEWNWNNTNKRPGVVGHYINNLVYTRIAPNFLSTLQELNPKEDGKRKAHHHSFTSREYGHPILKEHIAALIALGKVCNNDWDTYLELVDRAFPIYGQDMQLDFPRRIEASDLKLPSNDETDNQKEK